MLRRVYAAFTSRQRRVCGSGVAAAATVAAATVAAVPLGVSNGAPRKRQRPVTAKAGKQHDTGKNTHRPTETIANQTHQRMKHTAIVWVDRDLHIC